MHTSNSTVKRALNELKKAGAILVEARYDKETNEQTSNLYTVMRKNPFIYEQPPVTDDPQGSSPESHKPKSTKQRKNAHIYSALVEALVYIVSNINLYLPTMVKSVKKHYGNQFQHTLKAIKKFTSDSIISLFKSKKIGKRYMSTSVRKIVKKLEAYWDDNLPLDAVTRKLYFHKLADEYNKSFETIVKIEQRYRPTTFKPSRK